MKIFLSKFMAIFGLYEEHEAMTKPVRQLAVFQPQLGRKLANTNIPLQPVNTTPQFFFYHFSFPAVCNTCVTHTS